jgi:hypothetical protein
MEKVVQTHNLERYRHLLTRVTDEGQRDHIKHLMAKEEAKASLAIERDAIYGTAGAIRSGVIWA